MKKPIFAILATTSILIPLGVNAAQQNWQNSQEQISPTVSNQMVHNHFSGKRTRGNRNRMERLLQQLDLTSDQSQQIRTIQEQFQTENDALYQDMRANREQMRSLFTENISPEQLRQQHQQIQNLRQQLGNNHFEMMLQIREVLTPEQLTKMSELITTDGMNHRFRD